MFNSTFDLAKVIDALVRIRDAGWLPDLHDAIFHATRGPADDLDRWPLHRSAVEAMTRLLVELTGLPSGVCRDAACDRLLPTTRRRIVLAIILEFADQAHQQLAIEAADRELAKGRRGVRCGR